VNFRGTTVGIVLPFVVCAMSGCAELIVPPASFVGNAPHLTSVQPFSQSVPGEAVPRGWETWNLSRFIASTQYQIVEHEGERVLFANADISASGLLQPLTLTPGEYPFITWRWKVPQLIPGADNATGVSDDSPVRVIVAFDGDKSKLDFEDQAIARTVKLFSGREMPYATIQYIWENRLPPETVLEHARTSRSKMLVVESGPARLNQWLTFKRDLRADYQRVYGEPPGPIIFVGVMTDSNSTGTKTSGYYGDIRITRE
jgi:hypothetical protein